MNKGGLREEIRRLRRELTAAEVSEKSARIQKMLFNLEEYKRAETVMLYLSAFKEPSTEEILQNALDSSKKVVVPVSDTETESIILSYIDSSGDLQKGAYGILEPGTVKSASPAEIDLIIVPGLAFDKQGNRLGFGKGYYDKLLGLVFAEKIGLCYEFQLFDEIPHDLHDIPMNKIITEENTYAV